MTMNYKKFKSNILFFIASILLIIVFCLLSFLIGKNKSTLDKEELNDSEINVNGLVLNEIMSSNKGTLIDEKGNLYDYIEIYNGTNKDINLKNYGLSDENKKTKWVFPDIIIKSKNYLVVSLGASANKLNASFKLKSSGGEIVTLLKPSGKVVDAIETVALDSNRVMARNDKGKWVIQDKPTPGFSNNKSGHTEFINSLLSKDKPNIIINEILPENKGNFKNNNNEYSGYIEIKNVSDSTVNLLNYSISNSEDANFKWQFPNIKLSKGDVIVVYTSGNSRKEDELNASFKLKNKNGVVVLANNLGKVIDKVKYTNLANGMAYIKENDKFLVNNSISPGYQNTVDGIKAFQKKYLVNPNDLIINEVMNSNFKYLAQNGGNYYDWIELYNNSNNIINLENYCLTTSLNESCLYKLPKKELKPNEYYIVMASGDTNLSNSKYSHANFKLSSIESLYLTKSNKVIDSLFIANVPIGYSYGKGLKYGNYYFSKPTPNSKNSNGTEAVSYEPYSSVKSGTYNEKSINVALNGHGNIYYTLDGSIPTTSSKIYSSPLTIKETTVLRVMSEETNKLKSIINTYTYIMNDNHNVATMSIVIDPKDLKNVNTHTSLNSTVIEPCAVELFEKNGSGFQINAGLKLFGGSTRSYPKKSYEIKFKKEFGDTELNYKVFDSVDSSVYNSLVLRTGSQDEFEYHDQRTVIKDVLATSIMGEHTKVDVQASKPVILYLNGKYWGIYFIREKVDEYFVSNHYNVKATKANTDILRIDGEVKSGTNKKYNSMINFINNNSLSNIDNYNKIKDKIDIESYCDFWIGEMWVANYDMINVRYFSNPNVDNGKWKYIFYDLDSGFFRTSNNSYLEYTRPSGMGAWNFPTILLRNLMKNKEFKQTFLERLSYNLNNTWTYDNVNKKTNEIVNEIGKDEFKRNAERWNNSYNRWELSIEKMKLFAKKRNKYMVSQAKSYFNLSNSDVKKYFGDVE